MESVESVVRFTAIFHSILHLQVFPLKSSPTIFRFKVEREGKTSADTELAQLREQRAGMEQQVWGNMRQGGRDVIRLQAWRGK